MEKISYNFMHEEALRARVQGRYQLGAGTFLHQLCGFCTITPSSLLCLGALAAPIEALDTGSIRQWSALNPDQSLPLLPLEMKDPHFGGTGILQLPGVLSKHCPGDV